MAEEILSIQSRRQERQKRAQKWQHIGGAVLLLVTGFKDLHHNLPLAVLQIAVGALLLGAVGLERFRRAHHGGIAWVEIAAAAMMLMEAYEKTRGHHHLSFKILWFLTPVPYVLFAIFDAQVEMRRYLKLDDHGIELRKRLFWWKRVPWSKVTGYRLTPKGIDLGGAALTLNDLVNREAVEKWLVARLDRRGLTPEKVPAGDGGA